ncbi:MAG: hypothetical protein N4A53_13715 [Pelagimonas sp.]|jgi:hypothetical protein|nr:hypothetical protein [Pelagimonas sp.]
MEPVEIIGAVVVFVILVWLAGVVLQFLVSVFKFAVANFISTVLVVGGAIMGFGLLAGEASAAMAIAVPASMTVAKMRLSTGGF